ncbi:MAG TPA: NfeD family protein, partial [Bacillota bacterium]|nr:NfeD family protein [Bacillota bacterium]
LMIILRSAKKGKLAKKLILRLTSKREDGYSATSDHTALLGKEGLALSLLRPSGMGEFDGQRLDVVSEGLYIEPGTKIKIVQTEGRRIVVKPIE